MITVKQYRDRDGEHFEQATQTFTNPAKAASYLTRVELVFGGRISEVNAYRIVVATKVLNCLDTAIYEGPMDEMRPLVELVHVYMQVCNITKSVSTENAQPQQANPNFGCPTEFLSMAAPLIGGGNRMKVVTMLACGVNDEDTVKTGLRLGFDDLLAAAELSMEGLCSFREALAL